MDATAILFILATHAQLLNCPSHQRRRVPRICPAFFSMHSTHAAPFILNFSRWLAYPCVDDLSSLHCCPHVALLCCSSPLAANSITVARCSPARPAAVSYPSPPRRRAEQATLPAGGSNSDPLRQSIMLLSVVLLRLLATGGLIIFLLCPASCLAPRRRRPPPPPSINDDGNYYCDWCPRHSTASADLDGKQDTTCLYVWTISRRSQTQLN